LAERKIDKEFYDQWEIKKNAAKALVNGRDEAVAAADAEIEGTDQLELIGSTAIEDRLQDNVPDTI
jgi:phospholipid-transporting ATPase